MGGEEAFYTLLRKFRHRSGLSFKQIQEKTGFSKSFLLGLEAGKKSPPSSQKLIALLRVYGADRQEIEQMFLSSYRIRSFISLEELHPEGKKILVETLWRICQ